MYKYFKFYSRWVESDGDNDLEHVSGTTEICLRMNSNGTSPKTRNSGGFSFVLQWDTIGKKSNGLSFPDFQTLLGLNLGLKII